MQVTWLPQENQYLTCAGYVFVEWSINSCLILSRTGSPWGQVGLALIFLGLIKNNNSIKKESKSYEINHMKRSVGLFQLGSKANPTHKCFKKKTAFCSLYLYHK